MKIAYLGYDVLYPCLLALETAGCTVMELFTCKTDNVYEFNTKVIAFAKQRSLPYHIERITLDDIHRLKAMGCQAIFCAGYFHKVPIDHSLPIINVHPALIPSFCGEGYYGLRVHQAALSYGVKVTGATVHFVNEIADGGRIIMQKAVNVKDGDTPEVLQKRVMEEAEWKILPASLEKVCKMILKGEIK